MSYGFERDIAFTLLEISDRDNIPISELMNDIEKGELKAHKDDDIWFVYSNDLDEYRKKKGLK